MRGDVEGQQVVVADTRAMPVVGITNSSTSSVRSVTVASRRSPSLSDSAHGGSPEARRQTTRTTASSTISSRGRRGW